MLSLTTNQLGNRIQWVRDLVSGDFKQGYGSLKPSGSTYCCLGVACIRVNPNMSGYSPVMGGEDADKFGLSEEEQRQCTRWNDASFYRYSFARIADMIAYGTVNFMELGEFPERDVRGGFANEWLNLVSVRDVPE